MEVSLADPHAMQDAGKLAGESDLRTLRASTLRQAHAPGFQRRPSCHTRQEHVRCLEQRHPGGGVPDLGDRPCTIGFSGLVSPGVSPRKAPTERDERNRVGSSMLRKVSATTAPTPGTVIRRRQTATPRAASRTCRSSTASCWRSASRPCSGGSTMPGRVGWPSTSARTASAQLPRRPLRNALLMAVSADSLVPLGSCPRPCCRRRPPR